MRYIYYGIKMLMVNTHTLVNNQLNGDMTLAELYLK